MISAWLFYAAFLALATCLARGHGLMPDPSVPIPLTVQVDTVESEEPDTALAVRFMPGGAP